jgi:predicted transcriptional regulator
MEGLLVRDLMTVGVATCPPQALIIDLVRLMLDKDLEVVVVLDEGNAIGVVSQEDLVRAFARQDIWSLTAVDVMQENVPQVPPEIPLIAAAQIMLDQHTRALFLMHQAGGIEYPAGVITYWHLMRYLAAQNPEDLKDLGIKAERKSPLEAFIQRRDAARKQSRSQ